jgi:hypothetical protein
MRPRYLRGRIKCSCDGQAQLLRTSPHSMQSLVHQIHQSRASDTGIPAEARARTSSWGIIRS